MTLEEAVKYADWDIVTFQEASSRSTEICHFEPYIYELTDYVKKHCPRAKIALHATWGYSDEKRNPMRNIGCANHAEMEKKIREVYAEMMKRTGADILIPTGEVLASLYADGYAVHRDGQHASLGLGRYALALTWLKVIFGISAIGNEFRAFDEPVTDEEILAAQNAVDSIVI